MTLAMAVAKRIQELLLKYNMSQYRLIKLSLIDKTTLQAIIKGKTKDVKLSTVFAIAQAFGITLQEFFDTEDFKSMDFDI